jgi:hypothetical protein
MFGSAPPDAMSRNGRGRRAAKLEAGLLLVEAEPVGDRGRFPATSDPQLGEDP